MSCAMALCFGARADSVALPAAPAGPLRLVLEEPREPAIVASSSPHVFVAGSALSCAADVESFDLVIVIDTSKSTDAPTGVDIDGDGYVGRAPASRLSDGSSDDPGDNVLAAQIAAARTLVAQLDRSTTRVGLVTFAGVYGDDEADARTVAPLTFSYEELSPAFDEILDDWPSGRTNMEAALHLAIAELLGTASARSTPRPGATRIVLFMTDGQPTLPIPFNPEANGDYAIAAARLAARSGIRIDSFAIGKQATEDATVTAGLAAASGGRFTPVLEPFELISTFEKLRLASVTDVAIENVDTGEKADHVAIDTDGRFTAIAPLRPGPNRLEIIAWASNGRMARREVDVRLVPSDHPQVLSARSLAARRRLLETRLEVVKRRSVEIRLEREREDLDAHLDALEHADERAPSERSLEIRVEDPAR